VEKMAHPTLEFSNVAHRVFEISPLVDLLNEILLPSVKLDTLDVSEGHVKLVSALVTDSVFENVG
jgi:hypothetical protein